MADMTAFDEGYDAYHDGADETSNPYTLEIDAEMDDFTSWADGWATAESDDEEDRNAEEEGDSDEDV
jgi:hypothetical protein